MKKLLLIILLLTACSVFGQDTIGTFQKVINWGKPNQEVYKCFIIDYNGTIDTVCQKKPKLEAGGSQADSTHLKLYIKLYNDLTNALKETRELEEYKAIQAQLMLLTYLIFDRKGSENASAVRNPKRSLTF